MTRTPSDINRRRALATASTGWGERVTVVLYTCAPSDLHLDATMKALHEQAEARDWVVHAELHDTVSVTTTRTDRKSWPKVKRLITNYQVAGLIAPDESEIAYRPAAKIVLRDWLKKRDAFAHYLVPAGGSIEESLFKVDEVVRDSRRNCIGVVVDWDGFQYELRTPAAGTQWKVKAADVGPVSLDIEIQASVADRSWRTRHRGLR
ncbi:hypothetical protein [Streptomyces sp. UNOB3_S3]|uniref:hypothetical protein n=1 Tax=Streptomyces sp. UNOB3_S3 TaxID=2871682 RepID=UPI001E48F6B0|nr:hypothetical protein [Streptomyces sp. UNOB3_S3]MCC3773655.1 hypothetical protein [Streptomyces sp. UNOB3_S3]